MKKIERPSRIVTIASEITNGRFFSTGDFSTKTAISVVDGAASLISGSGAVEPVVEPLSHFSSSGFELRAMGELWVEDRSGIGRSGIGTGRYFRMI